MTLNMLQVLTLVVLTISITLQNSDAKIRNRPTVIKNYPDDSPIFSPKPKISPRGFENALQLSFEKPNGQIIIQGQLGVALPLVVGGPIACAPGDADSCFQYGDYTRLYVKTTDNCSHFEWTTTFARRLEDCFDLLPGAHWYGGGENYYQAWPIERETRREAPMVTGDSLAGQEYGSVTENYWVLSTGAALHVSEDTPLFISWRSVHAGKVCIVAKNEFPYLERNDLTLKYDICVDDNIKAVHTKSIAKFYPKPTGAPDANMLLYPFWSTWAQYKVDVNQTIVLDYAKRVISEGFQLSSHIEIDDHWESCYGEREFNLEKFPDPKAMVDELRDMNLKVTVWVHPFINYDCPSYKSGIDGEYFVKDQKEKPGITSWWQGKYSGTIDYTNPAAVSWWNENLNKLRTDYGIDSFKFDAGETNWLPYSSRFNGEENNHPNIYTTKYVEAVSEFGGMVEVRSGRRNQNLPIFTRMLDKDSRWGYDNGLQSLIPTLLLFSVLGYPFTLPDMIGGNAYGDRPSAELYVRWMQANAFMPAVQFSLVPWDYDAEVIQMTKDVLVIREQYKALIEKAVAEAVADGSPINRPMWWVDPDDPETFMIDSQYMLGDDILVAPVLTQGAVMRNIYLPRGTWVSHEGITYNGC